MPIKDKYLRNEYYRERYKINKEKEALRKRLYYLENKEKVLGRCKDYMSKKPKETTGLTGTGNYNITLAERHKENWLVEELYLYELQMVDEDGTIFYKSGLAKNMKNRLYHIPYTVDVISAIRMTKYDAVYAEREILDNVEKYIPLVKFGGYTECYIKPESGVSDSLH